MKPTKAGTKVKPDHAKVVSKHCLGDGLYGAVFPSHIGENHFHKGPRMSHAGSAYTSSSAKK